MCCGDLVLVLVIVHGIVLCSCLCLWPLAMLQVVDALFIVIQLCWDGQTVQLGARLVASCVCAVHGLG